MGPIAKKVIAGLKKAKTQKVVDFSEFKEAKVYARDLDKSVISKDELSKYDPLHAIYIYAQNKVLVLVEQLSCLPILTKLSTAYTDAEDIYLPSGPPTSPLTLSYFSCWGAFDLCVGIKKESFGTIIIDALKHLKADPGLIKIVECMQNSSMSFYEHKGIFDEHVLFEELVTKRQIKAICPSGYMGKVGEIWLARVMPEPFPELNYGYSVVFTTPYVLTEIVNNKVFPASKDEWEAFFERNLKVRGQKGVSQVYEAFLKYGSNRHYWNEFIFEGYVNHQSDMITLAGYPDIPLSMPHSKESQRQRGEI